MTRKFKITLLAVLAGLTGFLSYTTVYEHQHQHLEFIALDVGQGDAILIKTSYKQNILIDGGPDKSVVRALDRNLPFWRRQIDLVLLTHPDSDHVTGLVEVFKRYEVRRVMGTGVAEILPAYVLWLKIIKDENILMDIAKAGRRVELGDDLWLEILYPEEDLEDREVEDDNETSVVAKLVYRDVCFLLTGDAPVEVEQELLELGFDLDCEVLKVGHHGSKNSSSLEFLEAVEPEYAVISVGADNRFGHPSRRVIKNLETVGAVILRTDERGDVLLKSDGEEVNVGR